MLSAVILWLAKNVLQKLFPKMDIGKAQKIVIILLIVIIGLAVVWFGFTVVGWFKKEPKIDQQQIQQINDKNEVKRDQALEKLVVENADIIDTVDERTTISDADIYQRQNEVDKKVHELKGKVEVIKADGRDVTGDQLKCLLNKPVEECK